MSNTNQTAQQLSYTVNQAAAQLGIGRTSIYELIKTGDLTPIKLRQRTLLRHDDLVAMLQRMTPANSH